MRHIPDVFACIPLLPDTDNVERQTGQRLDRPVHPQGGTQDGIQPVLALGQGAEQGLFTTLTQVGREVKQAENPA